MQLRVSVCEHRHSSLVSYNVLKITALVELLVRSFWSRGRWWLFLPPAGNPSPRQDAKTLLGRRKLTVTSFDPGPSKETRKNNKTVAHSSQVSSAPGLLIRTQGDFYLCCDAGIFLQRHPPPQWEATHVLHCKCRTQWRDNFTVKKAL